MRALGRTGGRLWVGCALSLLAVSCGRTSSNKQSTAGSSSAGGSRGDAGAAGSAGSGALDGTGGAPTLDLPADVGCALALASGAEHTCVRYSDGRVACLGDNEFGQLGTGDSTTATEFTHADIQAVLSIAAAGNHTCAATEARVYCWGDNRASQLGVESSDMARVPVTTATTRAGVAQLELGDQHGCFVDRQGHGFCWGTGPDGSVLTTPTQLGPIGVGLHDFVQLGGSLARIVSDERLYELSWNPNSSVLHDPTPRAPTGILENAIGADHDCILKRTGTMWCRRESYADAYVAAVDFGRDLVQVDVGMGFDCALSEAGSVLCQGENRGGELGNGGLEPGALAAPVVGIENALEISLASRHACARLDDGSVWCWGTLPGAGLLATPQRFTAPPDDGSCEGLALPARPWDLPWPEATAAEDLGDAHVAWGQNQCRCFFAEGPVLDGCFDEEVRVLTGCLEALASDRVDEAACEAELAWDIALCATSCVGGGQINTDCGARLPDNSCGASDGVFDFCKRSILPCDPEFAVPGVFQRSICDGIPDCDNGFDEANCIPGSTHFTCADRSTVALDLVYDGNEDCPDGSDEWW